LKNELSASWDIEKQYYFVKIIFRWTSKALDDFKVSLAGIPIDDSG